jgi:S1-C subfamily serine protease
MALIPPFFLDCVVAVGFPDEDGEKKWSASGFLYGKLVEKGSAKAKDKTYEIFLVTNRHVFEGLDSAFVRFNPEADAPARDYELKLLEGGKVKWHAHPDPDVDVAVIPINARFLRQQDIQFSYFRSDEHLADRATALKLGFTEGDTVFVLGFPMGLVGKERSFVIVRSGCIARIRDALAASSKELLIDAPIFPGNSGGPVVTKPEEVAIQGTKAVGSAYLIGMVTSYVPYRDVAVSAQTGAVRIVFEENSGLASVLPMDYVVEAIQTRLGK